MQLAGARSWVQNSTDAGVAAHEGDIGSQDKESIAVRQ